MKRSLYLLSFVPALMFACSDDKTNPVDGGTDGGMTMETGGGEGGANEGGSDSGGGPSLAIVKQLNPAAFELAEGLAFHKGSAYVGLAPLGKILKIDPNGTTSTYGNVPMGGNAGYTLGLVFDAQDNLYVLESHNDPDAALPIAGIYKLPPNIDGGTVTVPFATGFQFPNGAAVDGSGNLLVTDSAVGKIFSVTPAGVVTTWSSDPELAGSNACMLPLPFPIGANSIVYTPQAVYVANTSKGSIAKIPITNGMAGTGTTIVKDCKYGGFDGLAMDSDGTLVATINGSPGQLVRIDMMGKVTVLANMDPLDGPASVDFAPMWKDGKRYALVTNSAFFSMNGKPGLLSFGPLP